jgi:hypothetical protein
VARWFQLQGIFEPPPGTLSELRGVPNGLELSCPAEAGSSPQLYGTPAGQGSSNQGPARRVSFSEFLGGVSVMRRRTYWYLTVLLCLFIQDARP